MRKICVFTGSRAEYGLLRPLMVEIMNDTTLRLQILASGSHLSPEFGHTISAIMEDGFHIDEKIEILLSSDSPVGVCKSVGLGLIGFSEALERLEPDIMVVLGDRFEAFSVASAAMICRIPIAHFHGGESTFGVIDEAIRHSITKMSHLHFTSTEEYRARVIQLGEAPERVFNVGALCVENIRKSQLLGRKELQDRIGFSLGNPCILVTFHPVTLEKGKSREQFEAVLKSIGSFRNLRVIFTKANADMDGRTINEMIDSYVERNPERTVSFTSMGSQLYLSAMGRVDAVLGNSSSGIIEAPSFGVPTVNIGDRQKGRIRAKSVLDCNPTEEAIVENIRRAISPEFKKSIKNVKNPYEKEGTARNSKEVIKEFNLSNVLKKKFYDIQDGWKDRLTGETPNMKRSV